MSPKATKQAITKSMPVSQIVTLCPESESILAEYGLHCFHCAASEWETLEEGCMGHGFESEEIDELVSDLNDLIDKMPTRPQILTLTADAARAIDGIATSQGHAGEGLVVIADGRGGFCMEFRADPEADEQTFKNSDVPGVRLFASSLTLKRIGGSTIDFREGRFKLDLPADDTANGCGCRRGEGGCAKDSCNCR